MVGVFPGAGLLNGMISGHCAIGSVFLVDLMFVWMRWVVDLSMHRNGIAWSAKSIKLGCRDWIMQQWCQMCSVMGSLVFVDVIGTGDSRLELVSLRSRRAISRRGQIETTH